MRVDKRTNGRMVVPDKDNPKKPFHYRGLTSFIITWMFLALAVTGIILYVSPRGRVANWTDWAVLGLTKEEWSAVHMAVALLFIVAAVFHIYFNWTTFLSYFKIRFQKGFNLKREFAIATVLSFAVLGGTIANVPPFSWIPDWNTDLKDYWENRSAFLPYPHAEEDSLMDFCTQLEIPLDAAVARLTQAGFNVPDSGMTLNAIADANNTSPIKIGETALGGRSASPAPGQHGHGPGYGQMTLRDVCEQEGIAVDDSIAALEAMGIQARAGDRLRELATRSGMAPRDIADIVRNPPP